MLCQSQIEAGFFMFFNLGELCFFKFENGDFKN